MEVPKGPDTSLQLVDDWHGKSRSVIFKNGDIESAPAGTFEGPPTGAATASSSSLPHPPLTGWSQPSEAAELDNASASSQPIKALEGVVNSPVPGGGPQSDRPVSRSSRAGRPASSGGYQSNGAHDNVIDPETGEPLPNLTVKDLKDRLKRRGLQVSGVKAELVDRLGNATIDES